MTCTGRENLTLAVKLAFSQHRYAEGYRVGPKKGLVFYWATPEKPWSPTPQPWPDGFTPFPFKMDADGVVDFALRWLAEADYGQEPDHDGDNSKGWSAYTEDWGHVGGDWRPSSPSSPPGRCTESRRRAMADLPDLIAQLRAAAEDATKGEWKIGPTSISTSEGWFPLSVYAEATCPKAGDFYGCQHVKATAFLNIAPEAAAYIVAAQPQNITLILDAYAELERALTPAEADVLAERRRQIKGEGFDAAHDDAGSPGTLALAAACYAREAVAVPRSHEPPPEWPWQSHWWKPRGHRRNLVKAAALILAEIERLDRAAHQQKDKADE